VVKLRHKKKMALFALFMVAGLMVSTVMALAAETENYQENVKKTSFAVARPVSNVFQYKYRILAQRRLQVNSQPITEQDDDVELDDLDEVNVDEIVKEYEAMPEEERKPGRYIWIVWAKGLSWKRNDIPVYTDAESAEGIPVGMNIAVKPIWRTEKWTLYKVVRGAVGHDDDRYPVEGYALKRSDGKFFLSLRGRGITLEAVGRVYRLHTTTDSGKGSWPLRVVMKGRMTVEGDDYVFAMRGRAYRLYLQPKPEPVPEEAVAQTAK